MAAVRFSKKANADLKEFSDYLLAKTDSDFTVKAVNKMLDELQNLADNPMLDRVDNRLNGANKRWYYLYAARFIVYYERKPLVIRVLRIWPNKRRPLDPAEV